MIKMLKDWLAWLRAWRVENERAHRNAKAGPCCSDPREIYAARRGTERNGRHG
ncbi:MAG: hypothetical protein JNM61_02985 [Zoogloeaceae bacterium]|nr:hypothetical protein [Zoogloeaceae bacterium]